MTAIISLIAIYAAIDASNANSVNTLLLAAGIVIFVCIVSTNLYETLFFSNDVVKKFTISGVLAVINTLNKTLQRPYNS
ncbi:MAG: hypothetical protein LUC35_08400 [Clostridiales bacterium]|nr:hypothetical protein [Clostridiales bacterium]